MLRRGDTDPDATTITDISNLTITAASDIDNQGRIAGFAYRLMR